MYFSWVNNGTAAGAPDLSCWCKDGYAPFPKPGVDSGDCGGSEYEYTVAQ